MSYRNSEVEQANKECRHLAGRGGEGTKMGDRWVINPNYGGNPDCEKKSKTNTAGYMGIPQIGWIAIIGVGVYYAYTKGMFKKLIK